MIVPRLPLIFAGKPVYQAPVALDKIRRKRPLPWFWWISLFTAGFTSLLVSRVRSLVLFLILANNNLRTHLNWEKTKRNQGDLWAVTGGALLKCLITPMVLNKMPEKLHGLNWGSLYTTWKSAGFVAAAALIYYHGATIYLCDCQL